VVYATHKLLPFPQRSGVIIGRKSTDTSAVSGVTGYVSGLRPRLRILLQDVVQVPGKLVVDKGPTVPALHRECLIDGEPGRVRRRRGFGQSGRSR